MLNLAARVLRRHGHDVLEARDGLEALSVRQARSGRIDLLITDVVMPRLGGPELVAQLRRAQPDLQVLYISGYQDTRNEQEAGADQTVRFLQKPFTPATLIDTVRRALRHSPNDGDGADGSGGGPAA